MSTKSNTFEKDMEKLREIVDKLSQGGISLDEMMKLYEQGNALSQKCRKTLEAYEAKLEIIDKKNGEPENDQ